MAEHSNYVRQLAQVLSAEPDRAVLWWRGEPVSAGEVLGAVTAAARTLREWATRGSAPAGSAELVVGVLTVTNSPATLILRYAANLVGATTIHLQTTNAVDPSNRLATDDQLELLRKADVTFLAVDEENLETARRLRDRLPTPPMLASLRPIADDVLDLGAGRPGRVTGELLDDIAAEVDAGTVAAVTPTSGTTGRPKGIAVTFGSRREIVTMALSGPSGTVFLSALPISHSSGGMVDGNLASGGAVVLHEEFRPAEVLRAVAERGVTQLFVSPPQLYRLLDEEELADTDTSSLKMLVYAGCHAAPGRLAEAVKAFGPVLFQVYGTGEAGMISMLLPTDHFDPDLLATVGKPVGEVRILDEHDQRELPVGEPGEICARTPFTMQGYWRDPDLTATVLRDGWVHTGDLGLLDDRGYLRIHGRLGEMVKTNGIKVYPATVENVLLGHPDVAQAAVFGVQDGDRVEHTHAVVVLRRDSTATAAQLRQHVAAELSAAHAPASIDLIAAMPLSRNGKPDKQRLLAAVRTGR